MTAGRNMSRVWNVWRRADMKTILVSRYHPLLVLLHWLLAVLIVAMLGAGFVLLEPMPSTDPQKIGILLIHMALGMFILALMAVRFILRMRTARPADATTGYPVLDRIAPVTHYGFYILVLLMAATGLATAILAGLNRIVFQGSGEPLPPDFDIYPSFVAHGYLALLLAGFISLHVAAGLYHRFVRKDLLLRRMWFGRRASGPSAPAK
jgi:cytochrome b561